MATSPTHRLPDGHPVVLGLDLSLTATGLALLRNSEVTTDCYESRLKGPARLDDILAEIVETVEAEAPDAVVIEGYAFSRNGNAHSAGELGGVVKLWLHKNRMPFIVAPPSLLKKFVCGKGNVEKAVVSKDLYKHYGVDLDNNNEVDAAALAILGTFLLMDSSSVARKYAEIAKKCEWHGATPGSFPIKGVVVPKPARRRIIIRE